jgi:hypothetical protein
VQIAGSANAESTTGTLELRQQDKVLSKEDLSLTRGSSPRLSFDLAGGLGALLEARLRLNDFDALAADNSAWLTLPDARPLSVFVPESLAGFRHALSALKDVNVYPDSSTNTPAAFDLVISDKEDDLKKSARVRCAIGIVPAELHTLVSIAEKNSQAIDWRRDASLLQHVNLRDVLFMDQPAVTDGVTDDAFAQRGYDVLAQGERGPLILEKRAGDTLQVSLLFHTDRSTLPYRVGFPIFVSNLVQMVMRESGLAETEAAHAGVLRAEGLPPNSQCAIRGPDRCQYTAQADAQGRLTGVPAPRAGEYSIAPSGSTPRSIGLSLISASETSLNPVNELQFNDQLAVAPSVPAKSDRSLWWAIAFTALAMLLVEWWWFQRPARAS